MTYIVVGKYRFTSPSVPKKFKIWTPGDKRPVNKSYSDYIWELIGKHRKQVSRRMLEDSFTMVELISLKVVYYDFDSDEPYDSDEPA